MLDSHFTEWELSLRQGTVTSKDAVEPRLENNNVQFLNRIKVFKKILLLYQTIRALQ